MVETLQGFVENFIQYTRYDILIFIDEHFARVFTF